MSKIPKYQQIINDLTKKIQNGTYKQNEKLPTEEELSISYNVSRMTVNKALNDLEKDNFIFKIQGSGTFVKENTIHKEFGSSISFSQDISSTGKKPGSELLEYKILRYDDFPELYYEFNLAKHEEIVYFKRLRYSNNEKVALSNTYISKKIIPKIDINSLESSFYKFLKDKYNIEPICSNYIVSATIPTDYQKEILEINDEALLKVSHYSSTKNGDIFEYNETYYLGSKFTYTTKEDSIRLN